MEKKLNLNYLSELTGQCHSYIKTIYNSMVKYSNYMNKLEIMNNKIKERKERNIELNKNCPYFFYDINNDYEIMEIYNLLTEKYNNEEILKQFNSDVEYLTKILNYKD